MNATSVDLASISGAIQAGGLLGLLAIAVLAFFRNWIMTRKTHEDALAQQEEAHKKELDAKDQIIELLTRNNEKLDNDLSRLNDLTNKEIIPALTRATDQAARLAEADAIRLSREAPIRALPA